MKANARATRLLVRGLRRRHAGLRGPRDEVAYLKAIAETNPELAADVQLLAQTMDRDESAPAGAAVTTAHTTNRASDYFMTLETLDPTGLVMTPDAIADLLGRVRAAVGERVLGQDQVIDQTLIVFLARGHALLEGVPGTAKTLLIRVLASAMDARFGRIQFTPDLMPADITGISILRDGGRNTEFHEGPIFTDLLLADEINRAPAKTQAALLEAMQERQVTNDGVSRPLRRAVHRVRDAEPGGIRGHVPAARSAARPLPAQDQGGLSVAGSRAGHAGQLQPRLRCGARPMSLLAAAAR